MRLDTNVDGAISGEIITVQEIQVDNMIGGSLVRVNRDCAVWARHLSIGNELKVAVICMNDLQTIEILLVRRAPCSAFRYSF